MKAITIEGNGPGAALVLRDVPAPQPEPNDVLVAVRAAAVNRADLRRAATHFAASDKAGHAPIAGVEIAGVVIGLGASVKGYAIGDRVMGMAGSAYAEQVKVDHRLIVKVPATLDWQQAGSIPVSFITAHDALARAAALQPGETVLVQGASTGAGIAAVQIAKLMGARLVLGTAGEPRKLAGLARLGCDVPIDYRNDDFVRVVRQHTQDAGVDVVIDIVGGAAAQGNVDAARIAGRIVCLGRVAGVEATLNLDEFSRKRLTMIGITFRTRSLAERVAAIDRFRDELLPAIADGRVKPVVDRTFALAEAMAAQEYLRANKHFGKVLLMP